MLSLKEFKKYLPKQYHTCSNEQLEELLKMFYKIALLFISKSDHKKTTNITGCIKKDDMYDKFKLDND